MLPTNPKNDMYKKQIKGIINPMLMLSAPINPINDGAIAPPTTVRIRIDEAVFVFSPKPLTPKANIDGNIIDINK